MTVGNLYQGSPLIINASNTLSGMQDIRLNPNIGLVKPASDGRAVRCLVTIGQEAPVLECTTLNIGAALALMSGAELPWLTLTGLKWCHRKVNANGPTFAGTSVHEQGAATQGTIFVSGIEFTPNQPAVMSLVALLTSADGTTHPVTWTQVAAPTDPNTIAPFFLDAVTIDSTDVADIGSVSVQWGVDVQTSFGTKPYPRLARPRAVDPTITVRHKDATFMRVKGDKAGTIQVTAKSANTGGPTRGSTVVTVACAGAITMGGESAPASGDSEIVTMVTGRHDGTNQPTTWSVV